MARWKRLTRPRPIGWHLWFAWRPVLDAGGTWVWWEWVRRSPRPRAYLSGAPYPHFQYPPAPPWYWPFRIERR